MSDRLVLHASKDEIEEIFNVSTHREDFFEPDYNITPGSLLPVVYEEEGERKIYQFQWGLIPEDADDEQEGRDQYVVKAEEVTEEKWRLDGLKKRRCIVPANGFYKWKTSRKKSTPFYIRLLENKVAGFAGMYSRWESPSGRNVYSFSLLTTGANALVQPVDDRMPVVLPESRYGDWLNKEAEVGDLKQLLKPFDLTKMAVNRVSEEVNDITSNGPQLIQPIPK